MIFAVTGALEAAEKSPIVLRGAYEDIIPEAARLGYDAIELHIHDSALLNRALLKELFNKSGIRLCAIGTGSAYSRDGISLSHPDKIIREHAVKRLRDHIEIAADYNAVVIVGLIKGLVSECPDKETYLRNLNQSLRDCLEMAQGRGITLVLEMLNRYESDFLNTISEGLEFLIHFPENLKLHIDTYHMNIEESRIGDSIQRAEGKIGHCHIADSDRWYAGHAHYDFRETVKALKDIGYSGALSVESFMFPNSLESAKKSLETLRKSV